MKDVEYNSVQITSKVDEFTLKTFGRTVKFKGYTAVYDDYRANEEDENEKIKVIPEVNEGEELTLLDLKKEQKFTIEF